jgi:hypothetical protein
MIYQISILRFLIFVILLILFGCSSTKIKVKSEQTGDTDLYQFKNFGLVPINAEDREIERKLLAMIRERLETKGLKYVNKEPDFLVATHFYVGIYEEYVPPTTLVLRDFNPDISGRREGDLKNQGYRRTEADRLASEVTKTTRTIDGYVDTKFYQNIQVYFVRLLGEESVEITWRGEVDSRNKKNSILAVAPRMLDELLDEFPEKTGKPEDRSVHIND